MVEMLARAVIRVAALRGWRMGEFGRIGLNSPIPFCVPPGTQNG